MSSFNGSKAERLSRIVNLERSFRSRYSRSVYTSTDCQLHQMLTGIIRWTNSSWCWPSSQSCWDFLPPLQQPSYALLGNQRDVTAS